MPVTYENALEYIKSRSWLGSRPGLERTRELLARMGDPQKRLRFVHIAGTNGKGSTAAMTASVLRAAGLTTGLYTSPFIQRFNERMRVDGRHIPDAMLEEIAGLVRDRAADMADPPTEFELITAIAMEYFSRAACDIVVLEVGMGGTLDSTNVIDTPEVAVITAIGLDHVNELGDTPERIAEAKAGIIKPGGAVALYAQQPSVEAVVERICAERGARLRKSDAASIRLVEGGLDGQTFDCAGLTGLRVALLGAHQLKNAAVVLTIVDALRDGGWTIPEEAVRAGLRDARWPGRFEVISRAPVFIVDGGHNPQCAETIAQNMKAYFPGEAVTFLVGVLADKDYNQMLSQVTPFARRFITVTPDSSRALPAEELALRLERTGVETLSCPDVRQGVALALRLAEPGEVICAFGSLYMTGIIRSCFGLE